MSDDREKYVAAVREYSRNRRAKIAAAVHVARDMGVYPTKARGLPEPSPAELLYDAIVVFDHEERQRSYRARDICKVCGKNLGEFKGGPGKGRPRVYCSRACYYVSRVKTRLCSHCGLPFQQTPKHRFYCSDECKEPIIRDNELKRRRERERTATMLAFKQMGLL
jgi:predicted nucleic acid-binding Zn ribbon protein